MSGFSDPRTLPTTSIRVLIRSVLSKTMEEMRLLQRELRQKTANERRLLASRAFKIHRHRLLQLYALLSWCKRMGLLSNVGVMENGPLVACKDAELKVLAQLDALQQALVGFPHLAGQAADHVNGLRHLQYTVMLSGKSVLYDVDTSLDVVCNGTYSLFPRLSDGPLALSPPPPVESDVLYPSVRSPEMVSELNAALRLKLLTVQVPSVFSPVVVDDGRVSISVPGVFAAKVSTRSVGLDAPWRMDSLVLHFGETGVTHLPFQRFVALPEPGHISTVVHILNEKLQREPSGNPFQVVWSTLQPLVSALVTESLFVQASLLATAASVTAIATAKEQAKAEAASFAKRSLREVASGHVDNTSLADAILDVSGWGGGHLRVRRNTKSEKSLQLVLWPLEVSADHVVAVDPVDSLAVHRGAVVVTIGNDFTYSSTVGHRCFPMIKADEPWISVHSVLEAVSGEAVRLLTSAIRSNLTAGGAHPVSHSALRMDAIDDSHRQVLLSIGGGLGLRVSIHDRTGLPALAIVPLDASMLAPSDCVVYTLEQQCLASELSLRHSLVESIAHEVRQLDGMYRRHEDFISAAVQYERFLNGCTLSTLSPVDRLLTVSSAARLQVTASATVAAVLPLLDTLRSTAMRLFIQQSLSEIGIRPVEVAFSSFTNVKLSPVPHCSDDPSLEPMDPSTCLQSFVVTAPAHQRQDALSFAECVHRSDGCVTYQFSPNAVFAELCVSSRNDVLFVVDATTPASPLRMPTLSYHVVVTSPVEIGSVELFNSVTSAGRRLPVLTLAAPASSTATVSQTGSGAEDSIVFSEEAAAIARSVVSADIVSSGGGYRNLVCGREDGKRDDDLLVDGAAFRPGGASDTTSSRASVKSLTVSRFPIVPWDNDLATSKDAILVLRTPLNFPPHSVEECTNVDAWLCDVITRASGLGASAVVVLSSASMASHPPSVFLPSVANSPIPVVWAFGAVANELSKLSGEGPKRLFGRVLVSSSPKRRVIGMWSVPPPTIPRLPMKRARSGSTCDTPAHDVFSPVPSVAFPDNEDDDVQASYSADIAEISDAVPGLTDFLRQQAASTQFTGDATNDRTRAPNGKRSRDGLDSPQSSAVFTMASHSSSSRQLSRAMQSFASLLRAVRSYGMSALKISRLALLRVTACRFGLSVSDVDHSSLRCQFSASAVEFSFVVTLSLTGWRVQMVAGTQSSVVEYAPVTNTSEALRNLVVQAAKLARYPTLVKTLRSQSSGVRVDKVTVGVDGDVSLDIDRGNGVGNAVMFTLNTSPTNSEGNCVTASALAAHVLSIESVVLVSCHRMQPDIVSTVNRMLATNGLTLSQKLDSCLLACEMALFATDVLRDLVRYVSGSLMDYRSATIFDRSGRVPLVAMTVVDAKVNVVSVACINAVAAPAFSSAVASLALGPKQIQDGSLRLSVEEFRRFVHQLAVTLNPPRS